MMASMRIARIEVSHHRLPLDPPFIASWDSKPRRVFDATIVRVTTDTGLVGIGSGDRMVGFEPYEDLFIGQDPQDIQRHNEILKNISFHDGRCWPLDLALWDLHGKIENQPCWRLLGGAETHVPLYASSGVLRDAIGMADTAEKFVHEGFGAMKVRFHRSDWRNDIAVLDAIRNRIGDKLELMVDCNQGWRMPWDIEPPWSYDTALAVAQELERLDVYWMEEPLHRADHAGMARLRAETSVRIAGGEMNRELFEYQQLLDANSLDVYQPDAALIGGITGLRPIAEAAVKRGAQFTPHTWTNGIGLMANAHLFAAVTNRPFLEFPYDPPEWSTERRDFMLTEPLDHDDSSHLRLSDKPGFGIELDEQRLKATRI